MSVDIKETLSFLERTLEDITELAWQIMLYKALPIVLVLTEPAFREVRLTATGCVSLMGILMTDILG